MNAKKAEKFGVVLAGLGVILILLSVTGMFPEKGEALMFAGVICFISAVIVKQIGK